MLFLFFPNNKVEIKKIITAIAQGLIESSTADIITAGIVIKLILTGFLF